uniref:Uncharacterized protein n=1 Tax=Hyaloperonospora arabidopsidis (strain Emoy2) TaxID=559515 RepID=M4BVC5_HYAAE
MGTIVDNAVHIEIKGVEFGEERHVRDGLVQKRIPLGHVAVEAGNAHGGRGDTRSDREGGRLANSRGIFVRPYTMVCCIMN